ncbi:MAG: GNAT family N-acetyltransferase [Bacteroidales bacterium]|nr:GNAT family N-acetyltransferase [Bacteroidales bacterium]MBN2819790.1 GNAT family N-acetyltransferase [Bacteroidales bacterium]
MKVLKAEPSDLVEVLYLLEVCVLDLNRKGFKHWNSAYPGVENMNSAIEEGSLYLYKEKGVAKGIIVFSDSEPEGYNNLGWKSDGKKPLFLKFIAVHPLWTGKGIASELIHAAEIFAKENNYSAIRVDAYSGIQSALKLYTELGYSEVGEYHSTFQEAPYIAYEKGL